MKRTSFIILCVLLGLFSCIQDKRKVPERNVDGLYVETSYFDLGDVSASKQTEKDFTFELKNCKDKDISISKVDVICDCVVIENAPQTISPKQIGVIRGHIDLTKQKGKLSKPIFVNFDKDNVLLLRIVGKIK